MKGRHEVKHCINMTDYYILRSRLQTVLQRDPHAGPGGTYRIRSLYFDNWEDMVLREKLDGVCDRDKFRIRYYDSNTQFIRLEKKSKRANMCVKTAAPLTEEETRKIIAGDLEWMRASPVPLLRELYKKMIFQRMVPKTIVDYTREPFIFPAGNVRITLDYHIRAGISAADFPDPYSVTIPIPEDPIILEVKWDEYLPDIVRDVVQLRGRGSTAFSKYAACRCFI